MTILENITRKVTDTAKVAVKMSSDLVEITKLSMNISTEEEKIKKVYSEIGKNVYDAFVKGENVGESFVDNCKQIESYEDTIKELRQRILELKNVKVCPSCSVEVELDALYCPKCGVKQEVIEVKVEAPKVKICSTCSAENSLESAFCTKCGNKLDQEEQEEQEDKETDQE